MTGSARHLRLLSYNIKSGLHHAEGLEAIARVVAAFDADVVALQEVDRNTNRSGRTDQTEWLRERLGYVAGEFGAATPWAGGGYYGLALLSRFEIHAVAVEQLWVPPVGEAPESETEPRVVLAARMFWAGRDVCVANLHLGLSRAQRQVQTEQLVRFMEGFASEAPTLVAGDFNANPDAPEMVVVSGVWSDAMARLQLAERVSFPSRCMTDSYDATPLACDYVFVSDAFDASAFVVPDGSCASDHDPVVAECLLRE